VLGIELNQNRCKYRIFLQILLCIVGFETNIFAQSQDSIPKTSETGNSLPKSSIDTQNFKPASRTSNALDPNKSSVSERSRTDLPKVTPISKISASLDTIPPTAASKTSVTNQNIPDSAEAYVVDLSKIKRSSDGLDETLEYGAKDSMWFDVEKKQVHLYGDAFMKYTSIDLKAGYILLDYAINTVTARGFVDSTGQVSNAPEFQDGDQKFSAKELKYNFKSKKGIIYEAYTQQEDLYVLGEKAKFVGTQSLDTTAPKNIIYNQDAILTTCDDPHPHFGIKTKKLKVIPNKLVVAGLSNLIIGGIPTPLILPFGFYPITKTRKMGVILPRDFDFSDVKGFGIKNLGFYIPINDNADITLRSDLYLQGSVSLGVDLRYLKKYKFRSDFSTTYNTIVGEDAKATRTKQKSFGIRWNHSQDSKAHPTRNFGGSVNIETNRDQNRNQNDYQSVHRNSLSSNLSYTQRFPGKPYQLTASMSHSQNTQSRLMTIELPNVNFTMQQIYPLKRKSQVGKQRQYEKLSLTYTSQLRNSMTAVDTTLFTNATLKNAKMGIQHRASSSLPLKIFKYLTVSPNINYEENWYPFRIKHELDRTIVYKYDTTLVQGEQFIKIDSARTRFGKDSIIRNWGFNSFRKFDAGISLNTALFFTKQFKKGWFRGIRHTVKPNASIGIGPDYTDKKHGYFDNYYRDLLAERKGDSTIYGIYDEGIFSRPSNSPRSLAVSYGFTNILEMKYFSKRDTLVKRVKIFDGLRLGGTYSITADSLKWSTVSTGGLFRLFKGITNLGWNVTFDPYVSDIRGRRINKFAYKETGKLMRTTNFGINMNTNFTVDKIRKLLNREKESDTNNKLPQNLKPDDLLSWFERFSISHDFGVDRRLLAGNRGDTLVISRHNISMRGAIPLTSKWEINVGNIGYDFLADRLTYPDFGFTRDLHCWEMSFAWQPERGTYSFYINVKPGTLDFLKVPYKRNNQDARFGF
jgi:hypothetical protein